MYRFCALQDTGLGQMAECFNLAFSDYEQPICFTPESLKYYLTASAVDLSVSFGAFCGEQMVGFILNSRGIYNDQSVVFDAGTGVVPEHRGKKVFSELFEYTCEQLRNCGIAKYYLEVLQANHHAISIYRKKGFVVRREYSVLVASGSGENRKQEHPAVPYSDFAAFSTQYSVAPSFEHTSYTIGQNPELYEVRCRDKRAYCIYAKRNGAIVQLHYNDLDALGEVLTDLIGRYPHPMAKNIDCSCRDVLQMLTGIGFAEVTKQYEMVRDL